MELTSMACHANEPLPVKSNIRDVAMTLIIIVNCYLYLIIYLMTVTYIRMSFISCVYACHSFQDHVKFEIS